MALDDLPHNDWIDAEPVIEPGIETRWQNVWRKLRVHGWQTQVRWLLWLIFPAPAYIRWRYRPDPVWIWPLFYPYRWSDILRDGLLTFRRGRSVRIRKKT